jgi:predicted nuclease of restriction endonuclease-like (RecB) superfamily
MKDPNLTEDYQSFIEDIKTRILSSRYQAARAVNKELILLYHNIGTQILEKQKAQGWGAKVIEHLSKDLKSNFPEMKGFSSRNLKYMRQFAELYPGLEFVQQVVAQLPVCRAWFIAWRCKSSTQPDGGEGLANRKGVGVRQGLKEVGSKVAC